MNILVIGGTRFFGVEAPYNGSPAYCINTDSAKQLGFEFTALSDWVYDLLDEYIKMVSNAMKTE